MKSKPDSQYWPHSLSNTLFRVIHPWGIDFPSWDAISLFLKEVAMNDMTQNNSESWLKVIWAALDNYRENNIPQGDESYDETWDELCTAMAWVREELGLSSEVDAEISNVKEDTTVLLNVPKNQDHLWKVILETMSEIRKEQKRIEEGESYRVMAISISHITELDSTFLSKLANDGDNMIMERDSGFFIKLYGDELELNEREELSVSLNKIITHACNHGFQMIEIDQAIPALDIFRVHEW